MKNPIPQLLVLSFLALVAGGCASSASRFYTLNSTAKGDGDSTAPYAVLVGPVTVPMEVDRPQFTVQVSPNSVAIDEFNRWAEPLNDNIARVVAGDLAALLGTPRVAAGALANFNPAYQVSLNIQKFVSVPGKSVEVDALWVVRQQKGDALTGRTVAVEPAADKSFDALAAAHSRALAKVSVGIAAAIRANEVAK
jgi:uncharacterized lipoprotein YmbA